MGAGEQTVIRLPRARRRGRGQETRDDGPRPGRLADHATLFLAAFRGAEPVGFVFGYELPRRHGAPSILFVYELDLDEAHRAAGSRRRCCASWPRSRARAASAEGFVLTETEDDAAANALYRSSKASGSETVMWDFRYTDG